MLTVVNLFADIDVRVAIKCDLRNKPKGTIGRIKAISAQGHILLLEFADGSEDQILQELVDQA